MHLRKEVCSALEEKKSMKGSAWPCMTWNFITFTHTSCYKYRFNVEKEPVWQRMFEHTVEKALYLSIISGGGGGVRGLFQP